MRKARSNASKRCAASSSILKIAERHERIVKTTGDRMLVEFASVIDAVRCAVEVQDGVADRNTKVPEERRISQFSAATLVSGSRRQTRTVAHIPPAAKLKKAAPTPR